MLSIVVVVITFELATWWHGADVLIGDKFKILKIHWDDPQSVEPWPLCSVFSQCLAPASVLVASNAHREHARRCGATNRRQTSPFAGQATW